MEIKHCIKCDNCIVKKDTLKGTDDICIRTENKIIIDGALCSQPIQDILSCDYDSTEKEGVF